MKNEHDMSELWPSVRQCGAAALQPDFARRVFERAAAAAREELTPRMAWTVFVGTALACLVLTLAINHWTTQRSTESVVAEWNALGQIDSSNDQGT